MKEGKYKSIATKMSTNSVALLTAICGRMGSSIYDMMQSVASFIIHCFDRPHGLTEHEEAMKREWMEVASKELRLTDPDVDMECEEATFYMCDRDGEKSGIIGALIKRPFFGKSEVTYNHRTIIERAFCLLYPKTYKQLRVIGAAIGATSVLETILLMMIKTEDSINTADIRTEFSDNERSEWGRRMSDQPYKRVNNKPLVSRQMEMDFDGEQNDATGG